MIGGPEDFEVEEAAINDLAARARLACGCLCCCEYQTSYGEIVQRRPPRCDAARLALHMRPPDRNVYAAQAAAYRAIDPSRRNSG